VHDPDKEFILDTGEGTRLRQRYFYFENQWFMEVGFVKMMEKAWLRSRSNGGGDGY
jgi:hypothetical protein